MRFSLKSGGPSNRKPARIGDTVFAGFRIISSIIMVKVKVSVMGNVYVSHSRWACLSL